MHFLLSYHQIFDEITHFNWIVLKGFYLMYDWCALGLYMRVYALYRENLALGVCIACIDTPICWIQDTEKDANFYFVMFCCGSRNCCSCGSNSRNRIQLHVWTSSVNVDPLLAILCQLLTSFQPYKGMWFVKKVWYNRK